MNYDVKGTTVQWALGPLEIQLSLDMIEKWTHHSTAVGQVLGKVNIRPTMPCQQPTNLFFIHYTIISSLAVN